MSKKFAQDIILKPVVSEKSTFLLKENKYVFKVPLKVNKIEIKKAVEELFKVEVNEVRTMRIKGKKRKWRGRAVGKTPNWKKAIVKLKEGSTIEELGV
ncbi:MAG: 50S ribosomal protein L23 [Candidatus Aerophobetes bacterium]|nr:50S ribosomal protein L23 [Candidatus Aerophobetes bacterium]